MHRNFAGAACSIRKYPSSRLSDLEAIARRRGQSTAFVIRREANIATTYEHHDRLHTWTGVEGILRPDQCCRVLVCALIDQLGSVQ